jgi:hypothetical protein
VDGKPLADFFDHRVFSARGVIVGEKIKKGNSSTILENQPWGAQGKMK